MQGKSLVVRRQEREVLVQVDAGVVHRLQRTDQAADQQRHQAGQQEGQRDPFLRVGQGSVGRNRTGNRHGPPLFEPEPQAELVDV